MLVLQCWRSICTYICICSIWWYLEDDRWTVGLKTESLDWRCSQDNYATIHPYPRLGDPAGDGSVIGVTSVTTSTITLMLVNYQDIDLLLMSVLTLYLTDILVEVMHYHGMVMQHMVLLMLVIFL